MSNSDVAEKFADLSVRSARGSNMYFVGNTIYSYGEHFPIAVNTPFHYKGRYIAFFNSDTYSNSTAKHQNHVRWALHGENYFIIETDTENLKNIAHKLLPQKYITSMNDLLFSRFTSYDDKIKKARKTINRQYYISQQENILEQQKALQAISEMS